MNRLLFLPLRAFTKKKHDAMACLRFVRQGQESIGETVRCAEGLLALEIELW